MVFRVKVKHLSKPVPSLQWLAHHKWLDWHLLNEWMKKGAHACTKTYTHIRTEFSNCWLSEISAVQFSSVAQLCPTLCDPMNRSMPVLPVHHQLLEFTQTHVHRVSDAIQPSYPLSSPSPPAPNPSQHQSLFQWVNSSHEVAKVLENTAPLTCSWTKNITLSIVSICVSYTSDKI